jgi:hypothetical protein
MYIYITFKTFVDHKGKRDFVLKISIIFFVFIAITLRVNLFIQSVFSFEVGFKKPLLVRLLNSVALVFNFYNDGLLGLRDEFLL